MVDEVQKEVSLAGGHAFLLYVAAEKAEDQAPDR